MKQRLPFLLGTALVPSMLADSLILSGTGGVPGSSVSAELSLVNERKIVGMQFDLSIPAGQAEAGGVIALDGMERHRVRSRINQSDMTVVVHSPTNAEVPDGNFLSIPLTLSTGAPEGGPSFRIENLIFTDAAGNSVPGEIFYHPLEVWRQEHFTAEQRADPEIIGDFKDPDGDGFSNIMEFLFSSSPVSFDQGELARQSVLKTPGSEGSMAFSFDYPQAIGTDGVDLWIETSPDLLVWTRESVVPIETGSGDGLTRQMRLYLENDPKTFPKRYYRINAARNPDATPQSSANPALPYSEWIARFYNEPELSDPAFAGEQSDPDNDGMVNLMEYLFGSNPKVASKDPLPKAALLIDGSIRTARLTYDVSREARGVSLLIHASSNLQTWSPVGYTVSPTGRSASNLIEVHADIDGRAPDRQFFQFEVQADP